MGRRVSAGVAGSNGLGGVQVTGTTFTAADNSDITVDPSGTGIFRVAANTQIDAGAELRFRDSDASNYVGFKAGSLTADKIWTLPTTDGTNMQALTTDGSGTLTWQTPVVTISTTTSDSSTNYIPFTTTTAAGISTARVNNDATNGLRYIPSTGQLVTGTLLVNGTVNALVQETTAQTGSYTLTLADRDKVVIMNNGSSATVTVPPYSSVNWPTGSIVYIMRTGNGTVTLQGGSGVTLSKTGTMYPKEELYIRYRGGDSWSVIDGIPTTAASSLGGSDSLAATAGYNTSTFTGSGTYVVA